jgi:hypothetical protein
MFVWQQATDGVAVTQKQPTERSQKRLLRDGSATDSYPPPPFYNTNPSATPPTGPMFPMQPPPDMPTCRG